ncbi:MAG TPA: carbohydrate ABC transporter permease [Anaerolineae bacterium]|nr:carbohydrate ABC transporter permease [Anaerolineae bacterium]HOR00417.1 carbohydrate ABC transporter permease [Anaerolineae bacterium]HPL27333.1 carbohydrate ABC transporter permease [Anaerolineae bacterium]
MAHMTAHGQAVAWWRSKTFGRIIHDVVVYTLLTALSIVFLFPFFWMLSSALKAQWQIFIWPPQWIPNPIMWQDFRDALANPLLPFPLFFRNTMIIEIAVLIGRLASCTLVAYGFARLEAPGKNLLFGLLLASLMLPGSVTMIPKFILFNKLGWVNTFLPLTVPAYLGEAYAIFLMRQFFLSLPRELEEAARIDGASTLQVITQIIVPLSMPVLTVIAILTFKDNWNDFMGPLIYLNDARLYTLSVGLAFFNGQYDVQLNLLMAASVVVMLPLVVVFSIAQRAFVEGITLTGLKG